MYRPILALALWGLAGFGLAKAPPPARRLQQCGMKMAPCPGDMVCLPKSQTCTDLNRCQGICRFKNAYAPCGVYPEHPLRCGGNTICVQDPRYPGSCGANCDQPGLCIPKEAPACAGFTGAECPPGLYCYDDPRDECDPYNRGADCNGICL